MSEAKNIPKTVEATTAAKLAFLLQPFTTVVVVLAIAAGVIVKHGLKWLLPVQVVNLMSIAVTGFLDGWYNHVSDQDNSCTVSHSQSRKAPYIDEGAELACLLQV